MILGTSEASSKETMARATLLTGPAVRFHYRADHPTRRLRHITLSARSCSCWNVLRQSRSSMARESHVRSDSRVSHTHHRPTRRKLTKKDRSYEPPILSVSSAILTILEKPMRCTANLKRLV